MTKETNTNIIDYAKTELRTCAEHPFGDVDSLILSKTAYFHWGDVEAVPKILRQVKPPTLRELFVAENIAALIGEASGNDWELLAALAASPRFRDIKVTNHTDDVDVEREKQFSATTFLLPDKTTYAAFRGTDDTLVGWKEDFNMAFITPVPAQEAAVTYLNHVGSRTTGALRVGGHSKGGNLAVYAAAYCKAPVQARITQVYSHDGPGFNAKALASPEFGQVVPLIHKIVPESSIVGMLLEQQEEFKVIKSDGVGIMQHDPYSWLVVEGDFIYAEQLSTQAQYIDETLSAWVAGMTEAQTELFVDSLFAALAAGDKKNLADISWADIKAGAVMVKDMDPDMRKAFLDTLSALAKVSAKNLIPDASDIRGIAGEV